jgi:hypothetical protein
MFGLLLAILLYYIENIGNNLICWDMSIIAPVNPVLVNPVLDDAPNRLKIMRDIYSL